MIDEKTEADVPMEPSPVTPDNPKKDPKRDQPEVVLAGVGILGAVVAGSAYHKSQGEEVAAHPPALDPTSAPSANPSDPSEAAINPPSTPSENPTAPQVGVTNPSPVPLENPSNSADETMNSSNAPSNASFSEANLDLSSATQPTQVPIVPIHIENNVQINVDIHIHPVQQQVVIITNDEVRPTTHEVEIEVQSQGTSARQTDTHTQQTTHEVEIEVQSNEDSTRQSVTTSHTQQTTREVVFEVQLDNEISHPVEDDNVHLEDYDDNAGS